MWDRGGGERGAAWGHAGGVSSGQKGEEAEGRRRAEGGKGFRVLNGRDRHCLG